jgi:hypothetical protein
MVHFTGSTNNPIANTGYNPLLLPTTRKQQKFHTPALLLLQTMYIKGQFSPPNSEHGSVFLYNTPSYPSLILYINSGSLCVCLSDTTILHFNSLAEPA